MTCNKDARPAHPDDKTIMMMDHAVGMAAMGVFMPVEDSRSHHGTGMAGACGAGVGAAAGAVCHTTLCPQIFTFLLVGGMSSLATQGVVYLVTGLMAIGMGSLAYALKPEKGQEAGWRRQASTAFASAGCGFALSTLIGGVDMVRNLPPGTMDLVRQYGVDLTQFCISLTP